MKADTIVLLEKILLFVLSHRLWEVAPDDV